ncbi:MAG TPA: energy transducer TonB [Rudaea sp.]|nr:energy transducer TonB [Rudaea sp.]
MLKSSLPSPRKKRIGLALCAVSMASVVAVAWAEQPKRVATLESIDDDISTDLHIKIDGHNLDGWKFNASGQDRYVHHSSDSSGFLFSVPPGHAFNLTMSNGSESWQIAATPDRESDGTLRLTTDISHNGSVVSHPSMLAKEHEPATFTLGGQGPDGNFKGFEAQITMVSNPLSSTTPSKAGPTQHASYRSITRIDYPVEQAKGGIGGTVFVTAHVAVDGHVVSTSLKQGPGNSANTYPLVTAALAGVQRWTFNPAQRDGKPVPSDEIVPIVFNGADKHNKGSLPGALDGIEVNIPVATQESTSDRAPNEDLQFRMSHPPKYPPAAITAHQSGEIVLKVLISETGEPLSAEVASAKPAESEAIFADASISAVMQWHFNPGLRDGKPYQGYALVPFTYTLTDDDEDDKSASPPDAKNNG